MAAEFDGTSDVGFDRQGNLYITDIGNHRIRLVSADGVVRTFAGRGTRGFSGDGGPAGSAELNRPFKLDFDESGNLYVLEAGGARVRKITPGKIITTVAGTGQPGFSGDGGPAVEAQISAGNILADKLGNIYLADQTNHRVRKITVEGAITTVAGSGPVGHDAGSYGGDGGIATAALLNSPNDIALDDAGILYINDWMNDRIRKVSPNGIIETVIGNGRKPGSQEGLAPDGTVASPAVSIQSAYSFAAAPDGTVYFNETNLLFGPRYSLRRIGADGLIATILQHNSRDFTQDRAGHFYGIHQQDSQIFRLGLDNSETLVAGAGPKGPRGDGGPAIQAFLGEANDVAVDREGRMYIADSSAGRVRTVDPDGTIQTLKITHASISLSRPTGVAVDASRNVYIADKGRGQILKVSPSGDLTVIAGIGANCALSPCGLRLQSPGDLEIDSKGNVYALDEGRSPFFAVVHIIRTDGSGQTLRGGFPPINDAIPEAIAVDQHDNLWVVAASAIFKLTPEGQWSALAGTEGYVRPPIDEFPVVGALTVDRTGNLYFAIPSYSGLPARIKRVTPEGTIYTVAGSLDLSVERFGGDGGPANLALFDSPAGMALDGEGNLLIADTGNARVRRVFRVSECPAEAKPVISALGPVSAASFQTSPGGRGPSPGEIVSVFGKHLGPEDPVALRLDSSGRVSTELGGTRVLIDGQASPMIYSSATQLSFVIPYAIHEIPPFGRFKFEVEHEGVRSEPMWRFVQAAFPAIFTLNGSGIGQGAILNQDLTVNGADNPAKVGEVIVIYATGAGQTDPPGVDGQLAIDVLPKPVLPPKVTIGGVEAQINYAGAAPFLVAGVLQVNVVVPPSLITAGEKEVRLSIGDATNSLGVFAVIEVD